MSGIDAVGSAVRKIASQPVFTCWTSALRSVSGGPKQLREQHDLVAQVGVVLLRDVRVVLAVAHLQVDLVLACDAAAVVESLEVNQVPVRQRFPDDLRDTGLG